jgi:hypothetical protein
VDIEDIAAGLMTAVQMGDNEFLMLVLASSVQIRGNVNFVVPRNIPTLEAHKRTFIIEGRSGIPDSLNFGALHAAGHLWATLGTGTFAVKIIKKAGSCVTSCEWPDSPAGKINKQIYEHWPVGAVDAAFAMLRGSSLPNIDTFVRTQADKIPADQRPGAAAATAQAAGGSGGSAPARGTAAPRTGKTKAPKPPDAPSAGAEL